MKSMRKAREVALQILFQRGFQESASADVLFNSFADNFEMDNKTKDYSLALTQGVIDNEESIDKLISELSTNWRLDRMALLDKILLQIAVFELRLSNDTPTAPKLCMTDIIDLAKKYSSEESKKFINGILDQIYNQDLSS